MDTTTAERRTTGTWGWIAIAFGTLVLSVPMDLFLLLVLSELVQPAGGSRRPCCTGAWRC